MPRCHRLKYCVRERFPFTLAKVIGGMAAEGVKLSVQLLNMSGAAIVRSYKASC